MAKGKTNQPLAIMVPQEWLNQALIQQFAEKGHTIVTMPKECINVDIIFGVNCHMMTSDMMLRKGIMDTALQAARKRKKEKK